MHPWPAPSVHPSIRRKADMGDRTERRGRQSRTARGAAGGPGHTGAQRRSGPARISAIGPWSAPSV